MSDVVRQGDTITLPPEALEAMRAKMKIYFGGYLDCVIDQICSDALRAAIEAWPGRDTCTKITPDPATQQWIIPQKCLRLPLKEMSDE